jgi:hypothetical protein
MFTLVVGLGAVQHKGCPILQQYPKKPDRSLPEGPHNRAKSLGVCIKRLSSKARRERKKQCTADSLGAPNMRCQLPGCSRASRCRTSRPISPWAACQQTLHHSDQPIEEFSSGRLSAGIAGDLGWRATRRGIGVVGHINWETFNIRPWLVTCQGRARLEIVISHQIPKSIYFHGGVESEGRSSQERAILMQDAQ